MTTKKKLDKKCVFYLNDQFFSEDWIHQKFESRTRLTVSYFPVNWDSHIRKASIIKKLPYQPTPNGSRNEQHYLSHTNLSQEPAHFGIHNNLKHVIHSIAMQFCSKLQIKSEVNENETNASDFFLEMFFLFIFFSRILCNKISTQFAPASKTNIASNGRKLRCKFHFNKIYSLSSSSSSLLLILK